MSGLLKSIPPITVSDVLSSLVVLLVAMPLCLGVAVAVGLPPVLGLISGIVGGLIVAPLGGSRFQITGPPAGLVPIVWDVIHTHGMERLGLIVLLAGFFQICFSFFRVGKWFRLVPSAITYAMLGGIGLLIMASQLHVVMDMTPQGSWLANIATFPGALKTALTTPFSASHSLALQIGLLTMLTIVLCQLAAQRFPKVAFFPPQLVGVAVAILFAALLRLPIHYIVIPADIWGNMPWFQWSDWALTLDYTIWVSALVMALVASLESLLTAISLDKLSGAGHTNCDRELFGQGVGNALIGFLGGMPITGVIAQGATNVRAGAKTKWSALLHGTWILLFIAVLPGCLRWIPVSSLAAVLIYAGYQLVSPLQIKRIWQSGRFEFALYLSTIVAIVLTNLLEGILFGLALFGLKLVVSRLVAIKARPLGVFDGQSGPKAAGFARKPSVENLAR